MSDKYTRSAELFARRLSGDSKIASLKPELMHLAYEQGEALHSEHLNHLETLGYSFAPEVNTDPEKGPLTDPQAVSFAHLEDWEQDHWMAATDIARKLYITAHQTVAKSVNTLLYAVAEDVHNAWASDMLQDGWVYGDKNDEEAKTCVSLLPFSVLFNAPELKTYTEYAIFIARELLINMAEAAECSLPAGAIQKKISDIFN